MHLLLACGIKFLHFLTLPQLKKQTYKFSVHMVLSEICSSITQRQLIEILFLQGGHGHLWDAHECMIWLYFYVIV